MGTRIKVKANDLKKFQAGVKKMNAAQLAQWNEAALKELAARLLAKVIKRTPVGEYDKSTGKKGGTLRRGWTGGEKMNAKEFADSLKVTKTGSTYTVEIINPTVYAPYVEFGHRTPNHTGWVEGRFMLTISEQELQADAPRILVNKLKAFMGGVFDA